MEDNEIDRKVALTMTGKLGLRAEAVENASFAVECVLRADLDDPFDLLLMDYRMPGLNGLATSQRIQTLELKHRPKIILLSAYQKDDIFGSQRERFYIEGFLTKPIESRSLTQMIADLKDAARLEGRHWPMHKDINAPTAHTRVLLVEDNLVNQQVAKGMLERRGIEVTIAQHGQEAIDVVLGQPSSTFDLIIMDIDMPVVDGCEAAARIKNQAEYTHIPIIALTAHKSPQERERCLSAGMSAFLSKPVKPDTLYDALLALSSNAP